MLLQLLLFLCISSLRIGAYKLPNYLAQCSLSDPNLNKCLVEKGNAAIPRIAKGDANLAIAAITRIYLKEVPVIGDNLEMLWHDCYTDNMKDYRLTNVSFSLKPGSNNFYEGHINYYHVTGKKYEIIGGKIVDIPVYGSGSFNMTLVGVSFKVTTDTQIFEKNGEKYLDVRQKNVYSNIKRAYYYFQNMQSRFKDDVNAYIDQNWEKFNRQMTPAINTYLSAFTNYAIHGISSKVPLKEIFLP